MLLNLGVRRVIICQPFGRIRQSLVVADGGIDAQFFLGPERGLLAIDLPVVLAAAVKRHISGEEQEVGVFLTHLLRQPFAHPGTGIGRIAGVGEAHVPINHDAQGASRRQIRNNKCGRSLIENLCCGAAGAEGKQAPESATGQQPPPPTKCTTSKRSPSVRPVLAQSTRETIVPLCSTATRSPLRLRLEISSWRLAPGASCGKSRDWPLRTSCIVAD